MALLALALMCGCAVVMLLLEHPSVAGHHAIIRWWAVFSVGGLALMTLLIRSGWSERLQDPSLTIPQMVWAITSAAVAYVLAGEERGVVPCVLAMILFFGALGLHLRQVVGISLYALLVFSVAVVAHARFYYQPYGRADITYGFMFLVLLAGCLALNLRIQRMRQHLREQRSALAQALAKNRELAMHDDLTGLLNRRAMMQLLGLEWRRSRRSHSPLILVMIDLDHFKCVNDTHGHAMGDHVLQVFTRALRASLRDTDVLSRWGGDEFLLMLTGVPLPEARQLLERVRATVEALQVPQAPATLRLSLSAGLALCQPPDSLERTLERADQALYAAKAQGRNCVLVAPDTAAQQQALPEAEAASHPQAVLGL